MNVAIAYKGTFNSPLDLVKETIENHSNMFWKCFDDIDFFMSTYEGSPEIDWLYNNVVNMTYYGYLGEEYRNASTWHAQLAHHENLARIVKQQEKQYDLVIITRPDLRWLKKFDEVKIDPKSFNIPIKHDSGNCDDNLFVYPIGLTDGFIKSVNDLQSSGGITHAINHRLSDNGVPVSYMQDYDHDTFTTNSNLGQTIFTMCKYLKDGNSN